MYTSLRSSVREETVLKNHKNRRTIRQTKRLNFWSVCAGQGADMEGFFSLAFCVQATIHCKDQARRTPRVFAFVCSFWFFSMTFCKSNIWVWNIKSHRLTEGQEEGSWRNKLLKLPAERNLCFFTINMHAVRGKNYNAKQYDAKDVFVHYSCCNTRVSAPLISIQIQIKPQLKD